MINYRIVSPSEYSNVKTTKRVRVHLEQQNNDLFDILAKELGLTVEKNKPQKKESKLRNKVNGSFAVRLDEIEFPELAQRVLNYAASKGLTIAGDGSARAGLFGGITNARVNDTLTFGGNLKFDVNFVKTHKKEGIDKMYEDGFPLSTVYSLTLEFPKIIAAIDEMAAEKKELSNKLKNEYIIGERSILPTYYELKQAEVGTKLVKKESIKVVNKEIDDFVDASGIFDDSIRCTAKTTTVNEKITVGFNFIQVGDNFIPVNDNQRVRLYV